MIKHVIADVKFSELWCLCSCGVLIRSTDEMNMPDDWQNHRRAVGEKAKGMAEGLKSNARTPWGRWTTIGEKS